MKSFSEDPSLDKPEIFKSDRGNSIVHVAEGTVETARIIDQKAERRLCRKFDTRLLPVLAMMYLFNALDKGNLGNAKTNTLEKDLHFNGQKYNLLLSIFYIPYVLAAPPIGFLGKIYGPNKVLPIMMFSFGSFTLLGAAVTNWGGLMTIRWFLGMVCNSLSKYIVLCKRSDS